MSTAIPYAWAMVPAFTFFSLSPKTVAAQELTDAEIAHAALTATTISVEVAELAEKNAMNDEVEAFATTLASDYGEDAERFEALAVRLGSTDDDPVSDALKSASDEEVKKFDDLAGLSFDRSYLARVIAHHRAFLEALDRELIPQATDTELDVLLAQVKSEFEAHLAEAEELASTRS